MSRLFDYFGFIGIASILLWLGAMVLVGLYAFRPALRIPVVPRVALLVAVVSLVLGLVNSHNVSAIEVIREEAAPTEPEIKSKTLDTMKRRREEINMPDGTASEPLDGPASYDYRRRGKVERDASTTIARDPSVAEGETPATKPAASQPATQPATQPAAEARKMPGPDVSRANRYDGINLAAIRLTFILVAIALLYDYFRRLNLTAERAFALPITGDWLDAICPKSRTSWLVSAAPAGFAASLAGHTARKGETFILCGEPAITGRSIAACVINPESYRLALLRCSAGPDAYPDRYVLEAALFNRAGVLAPEQAAAERLFRSFQELQAAEIITTRARRTVNIIWTFPAPPPAWLLSLFRINAEAMNLKLIVVASDQPAPDRARAFEEITTVSSAEIPRSRIERPLVFVASTIRSLANPKTFRRAPRPRPAV